MIHVGNKEVNNVYVGNKKVVRVYKGNKLIHDGTKLKYDVSKNPQLIHYFYHGKQKMSGSETVIPIYFTDYYQREYFYDDHSLRFDIRVDLDGIVTWRRDIPAGDYNLSLGVLEIGVHQYNIEVIQKDTGLRSHRLFNEIWIVDDSDDIAPEQTYQITEKDFLSHNIISGLDETATHEQMAANRKGITALLEEKHQAGFRKIMFPLKSNIRINHNILGETETRPQKPGESSLRFVPHPVEIPTNTVVDLNGSTIKLHPYYDEEIVFDNKGLITGKKGEVSNHMIVFKDCVNSCLCNGVLEGDYFERKNMKIEYPQPDGSLIIKDGLSGSDGEHDSGLVIQGGKHNRLENLTFKQITGYIVHNEMSTGVNSRKIEGTTINMSTHFGENQHIFDNGDNKDVDDITGEIFTNKNRCTSDFVDVFKINNDSLPSKSKGWFKVGKDNGVDSPSGHDYLDKISFYDTNKRYLGNYIAQEPRLCKMPEATRFIRITKNGNKVDIFKEPEYFLEMIDFPEYIEYNNCHFIDNRTCVNPNRFKHFRMYKCDFTRSGQSITPLAIDAEDGGATMQDFYVEECTILERAKKQTGDCTCIGGLNVVFRNNHNMSFESREEAVGVTVNNNTFTNYNWSEISIRNGWRSSYSSRIFNNTSDKSVFISLSIYKNLKDAIKVKKCNNITTGDGWAHRFGNNLIFEDCDNVRMSANRNFIKCNFYLDKNNIGNGSGSNVYDNCNFLANTPQDLYNFWGINYGKENGNLGYFYNCTFDTKDSMILIQSRNETSMPFNALFSGTIFKSPIKLFFNKTVEGSVFIFKDCTFEKDVSINLMDKMKITFSNCTFLGGINYLNDGQKNTTII